nr:MAG TPA: hypothetical protein [Caudoviricetes sp.]
MARAVYKLPYDDEVDSDIHDFINSLPRTKKAEIMRHAIRYYMSNLDDGELIKLPTTGSQSASTPVEEKPVRKKPRIKTGDDSKKSPLLNPNNLK